jgi:hypothetical protein
MSQSAWQGRKCRTRRNLLCERRGAWVLPRSHRKAPSWYSVYAGSSTKIRPPYAERTRRRREQAGVTGRSLPRLYPVEGSALASTLTITMVRYAMAAEYRDDSIYRRSYSTPMIDLSRAESSLTNSIFAAADYSSGF